ncbi:hypothetical protein lacNasYZ03_10890 [Lactobacillus nasalidis]|uniref:M23ase beta-sheet core domain-containing protein n=1 Tax=Lactobacillus nasalidis TaxID=2797258 RepID=A0ABQ3WB24_9LACO|nr:M23 family metallopeptidase [Lactobacillus nasalidis]GHV97139.1 hypothetical protein lacNasYZ01_03210 [Lactobacillus nasalidis]GHV99126.1 hypothetical protein lacNasYZ02_05560 [Lactobacillus nasalidis]GHW01402.1 hypothetical protein lacNasYZ03_10890 [Lactobacillus nasalidis]
MTKKSKKNKKNKKSRKRFWPVILICLIFAGLFAFAGAYINNYPLSKDIKLVATRPKALKAKKTLSQKDIWGYPFAKCYTKQIKYLSGQRYGKTDICRRTYPKKSYFHDGWDFGWSEVGNKAAVLAVHPGTVKKIGYCTGLGYYVWVVSSDGYVEIYQEGFASRSDITVKAGQKVKLGDKLGRLTASHLHLGVTKTSSDYITKHGQPYKNYATDNGTWLNPMTLIQNSLKKQQETKEYNEKVASYNAKAASYNSTLASKKAKLKSEESKHLYHYVKNFIK